MFIQLPSTFVSMNAFSDIRSYGVPDKRVFSSVFAEIIYKIYILVTIKERHNFEFQYDLLGTSG